MSNCRFYDRIMLDLSDDLLNTDTKNVTFRGDNNVKIRLAQYGISHDHAGGKTNVMKQSDDIEFAGVYEPSQEVRETIGSSSTYDGVTWFESKEEMLEDETIVGIAAQG